MNTIEPFMCSGHAAFLSNYFDYMLYFIIKCHGEACERRETTAITSVLMVVFQVNVTFLVHMLRPYLTDDLISQNGH